MRCVICRVGQTEPGTTTVTLERGGMTLIFKGVPAQVCANCGEAYVGESTTQQMLRAASEAAGAGVQVDVRQFTAAPA